ncbi:MAG: pyridoxal-phosphate dependent enzyme [Pseudomonadota bacterium]
MKEPGQPAGMEQQAGEQQVENKGLDLLNGAEMKIHEVAPQLETQRRVAADASRQLEDRLEAYEDIMESEVGDTSMSRARNVEREVGLRQIYLKFEGGNPSGTQKDRIAFAQVMDAMRRGFDGVTVATCGNYGAAMAFAASLAGLRCVIFIPERFHAKRMGEMERLGAFIKKVPGHYEAVVSLSRGHAEAEGIYDANPGGPNSVLQMRAYGEIAYEIYDELRDAPAAVALPVSNGTTLAGVYRGFVSLYRRGKISKIPRIVAGSSYNKNPIVQAFLKKTPTCNDLVPDKIRETSVNEPLINWHSIDGDLALEAVRDTNGWAANAADKTMLAWSRMLREQEGLHVLPASTAGLIALVERHRSEALASDRYVVILTGRRS